MDGEDDDDDVDFEEGDDDELNGRPRSAQSYCLEASPKVEVLEARRRLRSLPPLSFNDPAVRDRERRRYRPRPPLIQRERVARPGLCQSQVECGRQLFQFGLRVGLQLPGGGRRRVERGAVDGGLQRRPAPRRLQRRRSWRGKKKTEQ